MSLRDPRKATFVFVSGRLTLVDGSEVDSRQPAGDAATARAVAMALTATPEWWSAVSSVVLPTLDDARGGYALLFGARTVARAATDGEIRRSSLKRLLSGEVGRISVQRSGISEQLPAGYREVAILRASSGPNMGSVGFAIAGETARWRLIDGSEYYARLVVDRLDARILIDTTGALVAGLYGPMSFGTLDFEFTEPPINSERQVVILPDTAAMRRNVEALLAATVPAPEAPAALAPAPVYELTAPKDPDAFLRLAVSRADCTVSGLLHDGRWDDAEGLEAARLLLLTRFDLKLGLWDLATNPILRATALDSVAPRAARTEPIEVSPQARRRATKAASDATKRKQTATEAIACVVAILRPKLAGARWIVGDGDSLMRPLTEPLANWPGSEKWPLVLLRFQVTKTASRVVAWQQMYNDLDINTFVNERREAFEALAPLTMPAESRIDRSTVQLWQSDWGWGDPHADWPSAARIVAKNTRPWIALLAELVKACRKIRRARFGLLPSAT